METVKVILRIRRDIVKQVDKYQINDKINEWDMIKSILFML